MSFNVRKPYLRTCAPNEDSNQPALPRSLIKVFVVRMKKVCILYFPKCAQFGLRSDSAVRSVFSPGAHVCRALRHLPLSSALSSQQTHDVYTTSPQRHDVASTLRRRCINVMCPLGYNLRDSQTIMFVLTSINTPVFFFFFFFFYQRME